MLFEQITSDANNENGCKMSIIFKRITASVMALMAVFTVTLCAYADDTVFAGGDVFGVKFFMKGALVVGITSVETASGLKSPAANAGIKTGDIITKVAGTEITSSESLEKLIGQSKASAFELTINRDGQEIRLTVRPETEYPSGNRKIGVWVKDSAAGIGTVTFVLSDGTFGGLGHGITDSETGALLTPGNGAVVDVTLTSYIKGRRNAPGELKGSFDSVRIGLVNANTETGVYGRLANIPDGEQIPTGHAKAGKAEIRCTLDSGGIKSYTVELEKLSDSQNTKNFVIHVTDKELINKTGGIIQGMSGSPVIQDGKLVGAVTHVLVSDPKYGYGIFIENMLAGMTDTQ